MPGTSSRTASSVMIDLALSLIENESIELRTLACRSLARAAMHGAERAILEGRGAIWEAS